MKSEYAIRKKIKEIANSGKFTERDKTIMIESLRWVIAKEEINIGFEKIWEVYGPYNRSEKKKAREWWENKMNEYQREQAIKYVNGFLEYKPFVGYVHPALIRYLRNERWEEVQERTENKKIIASDLDEKIREMYANRG